MKIKNYKKRIKQNKYFYINGIDELELNLTRIVYKITNILNNKSYIGQTIIKPWILSHLIHGKYCKSAHGWRLFKENNV